MNKNKCSETIEVSIKQEENLDISEEICELQYTDLLCNCGNFAFETTASLKPRSFASLQLRARNAVKALIDNLCYKALVICGSSYLDNNDIASCLLKEVGNIDAPVILDAKKSELFGTKDNEGLFIKGGYFIVPCVLILNHPKWVDKINAVLNNTSLKLVLTGDAQDCTEMSLMWPESSCFLHVDLVMEFRSENSDTLMGSLVSYFCKTYNLKPFTAKACELLCIYGLRKSGDRRWLGLPEQNLKSICTEAHNYAKNSNIVERIHVLKALGAADFRANYLAESQLRDHRDNQILISTDGEAVGQINGLSVIETAGTSYEYGEPVRITASLRAGGEGDVIDIERKAELAGQIHAKAMMIINGYLTKQFGYEQPLPVSASLVFEQSYSEIDGDSASLTGLCAVISAFSDLPIRQDLAVTGAVDQFGDVQPVGGLNEKVEGFYRICRLHGLTGSQGVVIPKSCVEQLVLRPSVLNAIKRGMFHIYTVNHVKAAVKLLTSVPWGESDDESTIYGSICARLDELTMKSDHRPWWQFW